MDHVEELDALIEPKLKNWKLSRISKVSLAILRMAAYELMYVPQVPINVTVDEAVELAKQYAGEDEYAFINGVLGAVIRDMDPQVKDKNGKIEDIDRVNKMPYYLGIDTSNYTTSAAVFDSSTGCVVHKKKLLPVAEGALGLKQSDAVFAHVKPAPTDS